MERKAAGVWCCAVLCSAEEALNVREGFATLLEAFAPLGSDLARNGEERVGCLAACGSRVTRESE
jgi:hypothetical protein